MMRPLKTARLIFPRTTPAPESLVRPRDHRRLPFRSLALHYRQARARAAATRARERAVAARSVLIAPQFSLYITRLGDTQSESTLPVPPRNEGTPLRLRQLPAPAAAGTRIFSTIVELVRRITEHAASSTTARIERYALNLRADTFSHVLQSRGGENASPDAGQSQLRSHAVGEPRLRMHLRHELHTDSMSSYVRNRTVHLETSRLSTLVRTLSREATATASKPRSLTRGLTFRAPIRFRAEDPIRSAETRRADAALPERRVLPVAVVYRTRRETEPEPVIAPRPAAPLQPRIDVARLSQDVMRQIEKRVRIEHERRGRI